MKGFWHLNKIDHASNYITFQTTGKLEDEVSKMRELLEEKDNQLEKTRKESKEQQMLLEARIKELETVSTKSNSPVSVTPPPQKAHLTL